MSNLEIIYLDDDILCVNKPSGLLSIPDGYTRSLPHLTQVLEPEFRNLWIVHRLDRDTSGIIVLARNKEAHRNLNMQFTSRSIKKEYRAIVIGQPDWTDLTSNLPLRVNGDRKHRTVASSVSGKAASTRFCVIDSNERFSFVFAYPYSGYTHQIRTHLAATGFPILSDTLYQPSGILPSIDQQLMLIPRTALHAAAIRFLLPSSGKTLVLSAPEPPDFLSALAACQLVSNNKPPRL